MKEELIKKIEVLCPICDNMFKESKLSEHLSKKHKDYDYVCPECGKRYYWFIDLKNHAT